ncbi:MAG: ribosomal RNA small subunit methyltransferase A [Candidatus Omnitrophica bacterium]|nr:ribosomal RNA small subunit methyltransferase A [Candidatus Omnitrophota bacterium]
MLKLSEVKSILREYDIRPSKRLGQNFLIDQNIKNKIMRSIALEKEDIVLEIGPGLGALTEDLVKKSKEVIAVEKDKRLHDYLSNNKGLNLINDDILNYEFKAISRKLVVVGNLPYFISSPILNKLIDNRGCIKALYATVQMEFGERLAAAPGTKDYGSLSCYAQFYGDTKILFKIPRGAFFPVPEVDSCFLKIDFEKQIDESIDQELLFKLIRSSFEKRRKTILNSLASSGIFKSKEEAFTCLSKARISPDRRPETISLQEFISLSAQTTE